MRRAIDQLVLDKLTDEPTVVVGHSLGSVVAYNVLAAAKKRTVLAYITLGSPLGIRGINSTLDTPWTNVGAAKGWFNAYDERDVVALNPLNATFFGVTPSIVNDPTINHHGIMSYLDKASVGQHIASAFI